MVNFDSGQTQAVEWQIGAKDRPAVSALLWIGCIVTNLASTIEPDQPELSTVSITVLSVTPARANKPFAFASVEIDTDGVQIAVHGIRAMREPWGTAIELPKFGDGGGVWRTAITLPEEIRSPIARAVLDELVDRGLAERRAAR